MPGELLQIVAAVLSGGLVALLSQRLAFRDSLRLASDAAERRDRERWAELHAELLENAVRLRDVRWPQFPWAERIAWERNRAALPAPLVRELADVYRLAALYDEQLQFLHAQQAADAATLRETAEQLAATAQVAFAEAEHRLTNEARERGWLL